MRHLLRMGMPVMAALLLWEPGPAAAQNQKAPAKAYSTRRMADGHPDLQGTYDIATLTPVDRPIGAPAVYTKEEAQKTFLKDFFDSQRQVTASAIKTKTPMTTSSSEPSPPSGEIPNRRSIKSI